MIRTMSLFSGMGAFEQAYEDLKIDTEIVNYCEKGEYIGNAFSILHKVPKEKNLGDITKVDEKNLPDFDFMTNGFPCFPAGTLVYTDKGYVAIEDIKRGDKVFTHRKRYREVVLPMEKMAKVLYTLNVAGIGEIECTEEHPFFAKAKKNTQEIEWIKANDLDAHSYIGFGLPTEEQMPEVATKKINEKLKDKDYWFYLGIWYWFLKEGKIDYFKKNVQKFTRTDFTEKSWGEMGKAAIQYFDDKEDLLFKTLLTLPKQQLKMFLLGLFLYVPQGSTYAKIQLSKTQCYTLLICFAKAFDKIMTVEKLSDGYQFKMKPQTTKYAHFDNGYFWLKVISYNAKLEPCMVYNMEVAEDNSYTANSLIVHNCQAFSVAGKREGFNNKEKGNLFFDSMRIVKEKQPKIILSENVEGLLNHDNGDTFKVILKTLNDLGYNNYYQLFNSSDFGVPQNRKRIFIVSIRKDLDTGAFTFPVGEKTTLCVDDILDKETENRVSFDRLKDILNSQNYKRKYRSTNGLIKLYDGVKEGDVDWGYLSHRIYSTKGYCPTLTTRNELHFGEIKGFLTPRERFALQGFPKEKADLLKEHGYTNRRLDFMTGNSITVNIVKEIMKEIMKLNIL